MTIIFALLLSLAAGQLAAQPASPRATPESAAPRTAPVSAGLELQIRLDLAGFSPGEIDGRPGTVTRKALAAFQKARDLPATGRTDAATLAALAQAAEGDTVVSYQVTAEDVAGPFTEDAPEDMMERAKLPALHYASALEQLGERFHASPAVLRALNPGATFTTAGETLRVPAVRPAPEPAAKGAARKPVTVTVSKQERALRVEDEAGMLLMYAPVTVGSSNDPLPIGDWKVTGVSRNPVFHYNPSLFWDADPAHAKAKIPPGPNNPVGVVWIDLSRPHYGLHGTPEPSRVGHTESHGCVRLTNWDALKVAALVAPGTPVLFRP